MNKKKYGFSTRCVRGGETPDQITGSVVTPIHQTTTYHFENMDEVKSVEEGLKEGYTYTRWGNPTQTVAEKKLAAIEGGEDALLVSSGMAAVSTTILSSVQAGEEVIATRTLYGGTLHLFQSLLPRMGIKVHLVDTEDISQAEKLINEKTRVLYFETPTNPVLTLVDIAEAVRIAKENNLTSVIDNTFASPYNQRPLEMGVDVVIHSATKYLAGHDDVTAGVIIGKSLFCALARAVMVHMGGCIDPFAAYLLIRGLKTLDVRVERHNKNALEVARFLENHEKINRVYYPGLESHPQHELAKRQMNGFGGMVTFDVKGGLEAAVNVIDRFQLILRAVSLGGVQSLACMPVLTSHIGHPPEELAKAGITMGMIRLSVGIESSEDIIYDIDQALLGI
ncbi:MAG: trans-sulfuration enzyme family protein [Candidatus Jordarchaeum sp.]|uniref:trans-sulfuration enzyme family protein n=1 Tax=Candidatus Jordarchaeum sp. TaxID=2823881 RepID=UPI00404A622B